MDLFEAQYSDLDTFQKVLQENLSCINTATDERGNTILFSLLSNDITEKIDKINKVIEAGADVNMPISDYTPLMLACSDPNQDLSIVLTLLKAGAKPLRKTRIGSAIDIVLPDSPIESYYKNPWPKALEVLQEYENTNSDIPADVKNLLAQSNGKKTIAETRLWVQEFAERIFKKKVELVDVTNDLPNDLLVSIERHLQVLDYLDNFNFAAAQDYFSEQSKHIDLQWFEEQLAFFFVNYLKTLDINEDTAVQILNILRQENTLDLSKKDLGVVCNLYAHRFKEAERAQKDSTLQRSTYNNIREQMLSSYFELLTGGNRDLIDILFQYDSSRNKHQLIISVLADNSIEQLFSSLLPSLSEKLWEKEELDDVLNQKKLAKLLADEKFEEADNIFDSEHLCSRDDYQELKLFALKKYFKRSLPPEALSELSTLPSEDFKTIFRLIQLLKAGDLEHADKEFAATSRPNLLNLYRFIRNFAIELKYDFLSKDSVELLKGSQESSHILLPLVDALDKGQFEKADGIIKQVNPSEKYSFYKRLIGLKADFIRIYLQGIGRPCNEEQAIAIANTSQNFLLKARAGSGKTTTIINKAIFEVNKYKLKPDELRVLVFNSDAADELIAKLEDVGIYAKRKIASTFHSLAYHICRTGDDDSQEMRIIDAGKIHPNKKEVIADLLEKELSLPTRAEMYQTIRNSCCCVENEYCGQLLMDDPDTLLPLPQKYMADFLFEHRFQFADGTPIEKFNLGGYLFWDRNRKRSYSADFYIRNSNKKVYIRFITPDGNSIWTRFQEERSNDILLEFCATFPLEQALEERLASGHSYPAREEFEALFKDFLEENGILCLGKREKADLLADFFENYRNHFNEQCESLINQYQQKKWTSETIEKNINAFISKHPHHEYCKLLEVSVAINEQYEKYLHDNHVIDFNTLMKNATEIISSFATNSPSNPKLALLKQEITHWKLLCIDEFQDFSLLFFDLISAIKRINPEIRLFCVGDDWQAINGFAGSDTEFFTSFKDKIKGFSQEADTGELLTNRRCSEEVLGMANFFMKKMDPRQSSAVGTGVHSPNGLFIIKHKGENTKLLKELSQTHTKGLASMEKADVLFQIMHRNYEDNPSYFVLSRRDNVEKLKDVYFNFLHETGDIFKHNLRIPENKVNFTTVHKSKGLESDIVIILVERNSFPLYHPTSDMIKELFGLDWKEQERNLFYVALTRARRKVYFVSGEKSMGNNLFSQIISQYSDLKEGRYEGIRSVLGFWTPFKDILARNRRKIS